MTNNYQSPFARSNYIAIAATIIGIGILMSGALHWKRMSDDFSAARQTRLSIASKLAAEATDGEILDIVKTVGQIQDRIGSLNVQGPLPSRVSAALANFVQTSNIVRSIDLIDGTGKIVGSSRLNAISRILPPAWTANAVGDKPVRFGFIKDVRFPDDKPTPTDPRIAARGVLYLEIAGSGQFDYLVTIGLDTLVQKLQRFYEPSGDAVLLHLYDGLYLGSSDGAPEPTVASAIFERFIPKIETGHFQSLAPGGDTVVASFATTEHAPIVTTIVANSQEAKVFRIYAAREVAMSEGASLLIVMFGAGYALIQRRRERHSQREVQRAHDKLAARERFMTTMTDSLQEGILLVQLDGTIQYISSPTAKFLGIEPAAAVGRRIYDLPLEFVDRHQRPFDILSSASLKLPGRLGTSTFGLRQSGETSWYELTPKFIEQSGSEIDGKILATIHNISEQEVLRDRLRLSGHVISHTSQGVLVTNAENETVMVNESFSRITGYSEAEMLGQNPRKLSSGQQRKEFYEKMWKELSDTGQWVGEILNRKKDGSVYPQWLSISEVRNQHDQVLFRVAVFSDISEAKNAQERIADLAFYDQITRLPNRLLLQERLRQLFTSRRRQDVTAALIFADLDRFKHVNDTLGHEAGDALLCEVAKRWRMVLRASDTLSRIGGDEFVALLNPVESNADAAVVARRMIEETLEPFNVGGHEIHITCSIGITTIPQSGGSVELLMQEADTAMYRAKERGRNRYEFFSDDLASKAKARAFVEKAIHDGLRNNTFELHYQPKFDIATRRICGFEALIRLRHPDRGLIPPNDFIPIAEDSGLIVDIGGYCIEEACAMWRRLASAGLARGPIAVNFSAVQFHRTSVSEVVIEALMRHGIPNSSIEIEITESVIADDVKKVMAELGSLRSQGVSVAIDDFGTGYSSLAYLKSLPVNRLKIDRAFIRDLPANRDDEKIVDAIIGLARSFGLKVVAEGVETDEQAEFLKSKGCDEGQGYLFCRPIPEPQLIEWIRKYAMPQ